MVEVGVLDEHDRVELVEGVLVDMAPIGAEHEDALEWLNDHFASVTGKTCMVRVQRCCSSPVATYSPTSCS